MTQFFVLHTAIGSPDETDFEELPPARFGDAPRCPKCGLFTGAKPWDAPLRALVRRHGQRWGDVAFGVGSSLLVSDRFRHAWEAKHLRGIDQFGLLDHLRFRPRRPEKASYGRLLVRYGGASIDAQRSAVERTGAVTCDQCKQGGVLKAIRGFAIASSTWTGEDVQYVWGLPGVIVVTDRVKQLVESHDLSNVHLTSVQDYVWNPRAPRRE